MSFLFDLEVEGVTEAQAKTVAERTGDLWPVGYGVVTRRRFRLFGPVVERRFALGISDYLDKDRQILTDDAMWDAPAWDMQPELLPLLAGTIRVLGEELAQGFAFRATWVGSPVREDVELEAEELARIVQRSGLNEFTRYRVTPR